MRYNIYTLGVDGIRRYRYSVYGTMNEAFDSALDFSRHGLQVVVMRAGNNN
jgi:hypothetical protein